MAATHARLFFALWPDAATRRVLAQWQQVLEPLCGGRAMHREDLHLTLAFLGDTPLSQLPAVEAAGRMVAGRPFALRIARAQYWRHNKILWADVAETPEGLRALAGDLRAQLTAAGLRFDAKAFVPHMTLFRNARPIAELPPLPPIDWRVEHYALIRSTGGPPPRYRVASSWPLAD